MRLPSYINILQFFDKLWHFSPTTLPTKRHVLDTIGKADITQGISSKRLFLFGISGLHEPALT